MELKTIFKTLSRIFDWLWNINLVLGVLALAFITYNTISKKNIITAGYLGQFETKTEQHGNISSLMETTELFISDLNVTPSIIINTDLNLWLMYGYVLFILGIVLGYNYQIMILFKSLSNHLNGSSIFTQNLIHRFNVLAKFSLLFFTLGLSLSILKLIIVDQIYFNGMVLHPVFDNKILNLAWLGIGFLILAGIFKIGHQLQTDNDLTI